MLQTVMSTRTELLCQHFLFYFHLIHFNVMAFFFKLFVFVELEQYVTAFFLMFRGFAVTKIRRKTLRVN